MVNTFSYDAAFEKLGHGLCHTGENPITVFKFIQALTGAPIQNLEFGTFLKKAPQRQNLGIWDLIGTFLGPFLYPIETVTLCYT